MQAPKLETIIGSKIVEDKYTARPTKKSSYTVTKKRKNRKAPIPQVTRLGSDIHSMLDH